MANQPIPKALYTQILETMPIVCVDVLVWHQGRVLLVKRATEPAKGLWWFPGGRLMKHETLEDAARRKCREEIGLEVEILQPLGIWETEFDTAPFAEVRTGVHSVNVCFAARPTGDGAPPDGARTDETSEELRWIDHLEDDLPDYIHEVVAAAGIWQDGSAEE